MLSLDRSLLDSESAGADRFRGYARYADEIHVVIPTMDDTRERISLAPTIHLYPTASPARWRYYIDIPAVASSILKNADTNEWILTTQDPFDLGILGWWIARAHRIALHVQDHQDCFSGAWWRSRSLANRIRYHIGRFVLKRAHAIRVVSKRSRSALVALGILESKIAIVPMYTPIKHIESAQPTFDLHERYGRDSFIALYIGRFSPEKDLGFLLDAFEQVAETAPRVHLVMVGSGNNDASVKARAATSIHADRIHIEGWSDDIVSYLKTADVLLLSSRYEGWGRVLIEALAGRLPIVTTDVGCVGEVVRDEETALVVPVGDTDAFARALERLVKDESLRMRFKENVPRALAGLMSREETDRAFFASIEQALKNR